ncbi:MAG: hypothetical protein H6573_00360 [Lewinellaceae bacterium]|nr:hypothetical protein [Phaeodactylibacter sp.]MCB9345949.1 hypothetical protein [Lewinellaceae bacterium]
MFVSPIAYQSHYEVRNYEIDDRRMAPIPKYILELQNEMPPPEACLPRPETWLPRFEQAQFTKNFEVNWHDLDFNEHLNNTLIYTMDARTPAGSDPGKRWASATRYQLPRRMPLAGPRARRGTTPGRRWTVPAPARQCQR